MIRKQIAILCVLLLGLTSTARGETQTAAPLEIGVFPYLSTRAILGAYHPLQEYLEKRLQRPVIMVTAPDMRTFVERTQAGAYPYVVTAPHFARLAQREAGYRPLLRAKRELSGVLLVSNTGGIGKLADLRGKIIATPDTLAIITELGKGLLKQNGLVPGRDVTLQEAPSHNSAVLSVQQGAVSAAIVSVTAFMQMPEEQRRGLWVLGRTSEVPHVMIMARPDIPARDVDRFVALMREFVDTTPEGKKFIDGLGYLGLRPPTEAELRSLDSYLDGLKAGLAEPR